ncbi:PAS domain S-box protein [Desulfopila aestuarii]|uniref:histidine kinase n=1 Tax=Desulfopila aestuarii DSM 18488 TaxID=1121416 RepID=A0A1M7Y3N3_9BACT|nr:PAS domain S-box protein [Desulfopila aestuarii]SHO46757.1 PAS domain S-box-containing protein [Desulfopila aestuarii DSM 18488]
MTDSAAISEESRYHLLFDNMVSGFAYHKIITNKDGEPVDYEFLSVNKAFERFTGLKRTDIIGKRVTEAIPEIATIEFDWIGVYGKVALTGKPVVFERYFEPLKRWYYISAYCPEKFHFAVTFDDITFRKNVEKKLRDHESQFQIVTDNSVAFIAYVGMDDLRYEFVNKKYEESYGIPRQNIIGKHIKEIIGSRHYDVALNYIQDVKQGKTVSFLQSYDFKDGRRSLKVNLVPEFDDHKRVVGMVVLSYDITELKEIQNALEESERKYRSLFDKNENGIFIYDQETLIILDANPAMTEIYGFNYDELVGMNCLALSSEVSESVKASEIIKNSGRLNVEIRWHKKKDNTIFPVELEAFSVESYGRRIGYTLIKDLTERKKAEDALRESEEKYRKIFNEAQVALFRTRISDGQLIDANEEYAKMAGYPNVRECIGHFHPGRSWVDQKSRKKMIDLLVKKGSVRGYEAQIVRRDGVSIWVRFSATIYPENGYIEGSIEDITKQRDAYEQLKDINTALDVLLKKREEDSKKIEENIFSNYELMIMPFLNRLKYTDLNANQQNLINIIEENLTEIVDPFVKKLSNSMMRLTQSEIQIATMIKQGLTNKEIAQTLNCSKRTVDTHRENIRKKLHLTNNKVNLKTYLLHL